MIGAFIALAAWLASNRRTSGSVIASPITTGVGLAIGSVSAVTAWNAGFVTLRRAADVVWILWSVAGGAYLGLLVVSLLGVVTKMNQPQAPAGAPKAEQPDR